MHRLWSGIHSRLQAARSVKQAAAATCAPQLLPSDIQLRAARMGFPTFGSAPVVAAAPQEQAMQRVNGEMRASTSSSSGGGAPAPPRPGQAKQQQQQQQEKKKSESGSGSGDTCWTEVTGARLHAIMRGSAALDMAAHKAQQVIKQRRQQWAEKERQRNERGPSADVLEALAERRRQYEAAAAARGGDGTVYVGVAASEKQQLLAAAKATKEAAAAAVQDPSKDFIQAYYNQMEGELRMASAQASSKLRRASGAGGSGSASSSGGGAASGSLGDDGEWGGFGDEEGLEGEGLEDEEDAEALPAWA